MTASATSHSGSHSGSPAGRSLQDDLLADLRQTAPMPDPRPSAVRPRPKPDALQTGSTQPAVEVRVTRTRWLSPSMRLASKGLVVSAGPISVSVGLSRR
jgi:hypothetical protein